MASLGTGDNVAVIYERGGTRRLFEVPAVASLEWGRSLDAISRSTIGTTPARSGTRGWADCCSELAQVQPWRHEVVMYRSGERVWEGPVRRVIQNRSGVQVIASDVLGWSERRVQTTDLIGAADVGDVAQDALTAVFSGVVSNVLTYLDVTGVTGDLDSVFDVKAGGYWSALLSTLVGLGLSYTVVGRRIILWDTADTPLGETPILNPTRHLIGDVETAREGDDLAVDAFAVNDDGEVGTSTEDPTYYGAVQRTVQASGVVGVAALNDVAARWQALRYPVPESLNVPDGSTLHCDAPFPIEALVPGVVTPVKVTDLCWPVEQSMILTAVKVTQDQAGEKVGVTYAPIASGGD